MDSAAVRATVEARLAPRFPNALRFQAPATAECVPSGVLEIDRLTGGLPRGAVTEFFSRPSDVFSPRPVVNSVGRSGFALKKHVDDAPLSSGCTSVMLSALAEATTTRQESCALLDASNAFDPASAEAAGVDLSRLLWVRCSGTKLSNLEQVLKVTDLLLQAGGFGMVIVDLNDVASSVARKIPLATWFRFRRAVENTHTVLLVFEQEPYAKSCAALAACVQQKSPSVAGHRPLGSLMKQANLEDCFSGSGPSHVRLLHGMDVSVEVVRSSAERKPMMSAKTVSRFSFMVSG
jgi:recombination protein RecA